MSLTEKFIRIRRSAGSGAVLQNFLVSQRNLRSWLHSPLDDSVHDFLASDVRIRVHRKLLQNLFLHGWPTTRSGSFERRGKHCPPLKNFLKRQLYNAVAAYDLLRERQKSSPFCPAGYRAKKRNEKMAVCVVVIEKC